MHSALDCRFGTGYNHLSTEKLAKFQKMFECLKLIVIDEMSMVSSDSLYDVDHRLKDIMISQETFAGCAFVLVGDLLQLPPIQGSPIFAPPKCPKNKAMASVFETDSAGIKRKGIWANMDVVNLKTNFRQGQGQWVECLNRIRVLTDISELTKEDMDLLESRRLSRHSDIDLDWAMNAYYTNFEVQEHNSDRLCPLEPPLYQAEATIRHIPGYKPFITKQGTIEDTNFLKTFKFKVKARTMLIYNVNVSDSLVNGSMGTIVGVKSEESKVKAIVVSFDDPNTGEEQKVQYRNIADEFTSQNGIPILQVKQEYSRKGQAKKTRGCLIQFPLQLAWASTVHKLQGDTIKSGKNYVVHGHKRMPPSMGYTALSRCSKESNIFIADSFDFEKHLKCNLKSLKAKIQLDERNVAPTYEKMEFDLFFVNIRSLQANLEDLKHDMHAMQSRITCLVETWIPPLTSKRIDYSIEGRKMEDISWGKGKGCCAYLKETECWEILGKISTEMFQILSLKTKDKIQLSIVYLSSGASLVKVQQYLNQIRQQNLPQIIIGDFNFDSKESNTLSFYFAEIGMKQLVERPTRMSGRTIDHVYVSSDLKCELTFKSLYYSDHVAICLKLNKD